MSLDFNPVMDALRVVTGSDQNYRINPDTGALIAQDTNVNSSALIAGIAYDNNVVGASQTSLYFYDFNVDVIGTIGSLNGNPNSPNTGILETIGSSGFVADSAALGFDISGATGVGYIVLDDTTTPTVNSEFYSVNLATGALTLLSAGEQSLPILDTSVQPAPIPEPATVAMFGMVAVVGGLLWCRRRQAA